MYARWSLDEDHPRARVQQALDVRADWVEARIREGGVHCRLGGEEDCRLEGGGMGFEIFRASFRKSGGGMIIWAGEV